MVDKDGNKVAYIKGKISNSGKAHGLDKSYTMECSGSGNCLLAYDGEHVLYSRMSNCLLFDSNEFKDYAPRLPEIYVEAFKGDLKYAQSILKWYEKTKDVLREEAIEFAKDVEWLKKQHIDRWHL